MGTRVEDVFRDFEGRRAGLIKALTTNLDELLRLCHPVVIGGGRKPKKDKTPKSSTKSKKSSPKPESESPKLAPPEEDEGIEGKGEEDAVCGACGIKSFDEFWICCDVCDTWYHGSCVGITPAAAHEHSKYQCPSCSNKRQRH